MKDTMLYVIKFLRDIVLITIAVVGLWWWAAPSAQADECTEVSVSITPFIQGSDTAGISCPGGEYGWEIQTQFNKDISLRCRTQRSAVMIFSWEVASQMVGANWELDFLPKMRQSWTPVMTEMIANGECVFEKR